MRQLSPSVVFGAVLLFFVPAPVQGQLYYDGNLANVEAVNPEIGLTWDDDLPVTESAMKTRLQTLFELELRNIGISISTDASNILDVDLVVLTCPQEWYHILC